MVEIKPTTPNDVVAVVTGIQIGEETKGAAVEWLARELQAHTVVRNGGCQAGHHIVTSDGREQMFSHFAAATFEGTRTYLRHMVIDPVLLFTEALEIESKGIDDPFSIITIDGENISITPFHGALSRLKEILRSEKKGTVGLGVGDAVKDALQGQTTIKAKDFLKTETELTAQVEAIRQRKIQQALELIVALGIEELPVAASSQMELLYNTELVSLTVQSFMYLADLVHITTDDDFDHLMNEPGNIVTEPSHGALLHPYAFAPHSTQVDPTSQELIAELRQKNTKKVVRLGVGRCYMTRHGAGPLVSFDRTMTDTIHETHNAANPWANEWLGEFRIGNFDLIATRYGLDISGGAQAFDGFLMSYLDVLNTYHRWGIVEAYTFDGDDADLHEYFEMQGPLITGIKLHPDTRDDAHYNHQLRLTELLKKCSPVVTYLYPTEEKSLEEVFIDYFEEKTGVVVVATSRGPKAEDREKRPAWDAVFNVNPENESRAAAQMYRPLGVDLYFAGQEETHLTQEIMNNPTLLKEAALRRELNDLLMAIFSKIPDPTLSFDAAIEKELLSAPEAAEMYKKLAEFISADENHGRIILYLPTQLLPQIQPEGSNSPESLQFLAAYIDAWFRLLYESEPRASYVDGDILEAGMGIPARIRKAAHLVPDLLSCRFIDFSEIILLLEITDESELLESLSAGVLVARDRHLISDQEWESFQQLALTKPEIAKVGSAQKRPESHIHADFSAVLAGIETKYSPGSHSVAAMSSERVTWEKQVAFEKACDDEAVYQAQRVRSGETTVEEVISVHKIVGIKTIDRIGKDLVRKSIGEAHEFAQKNKAILEKQFSSDNNGIKDAIASCLSHWQKLGIVDESYLHEFGVEVTDLAQPFPIDLQKRQEADGLYAIEAAKKIGQHPILSQYLFPLVVEVGSRVKGQAGFGTDYDGGIVFRPETPWEKRLEVLQILRQDISELARIEKPLEFWLSSTESDYGLRTAPTEIKTVVNPAQIHLFTNGIWTSQTDEFLPIRDDLLNKYLNLARFGEHKEEARGQLLRQLEMDELQYRLMHKGFRRFYPVLTSVGTEHSELIDGESDYWDPQYRRIATHQFLSRVFLPDLS